MHPNIDCILQVLQFFENRVPYYAWYTRLNIYQMHFSKTLVYQVESMLFIVDLMLCHIIPLK